jgi:hypothetical protein
MLTVAPGNGSLLLLITNNKSDCACTLHEINMMNMLKKKDFFIFGKIICNRIIEKHPATGLQSNLLQRCHNIRSGHFLIAIQLESAGE